MRVCIYGNPTIDIVISKDGDRAIMHGGGVYYSSIPFINKGYNVEVYSVYSPLIHEHPIRSLIVKRQYSTRTNIFLLDYTGSERSIEVRERSDRLASWNIHDGICVSLVNPVLGEVDTSLLRNIRLRSSILAVDIQGFIREQRQHRIHNVFKPEIIDVFREADIIHMDREEFDAILSGLTTHDTAQLQKLAKGVIVVTERPNKVTLITREVVRSMVLEMEDLIADKTGAGDYFLSAFTIHYLRETDYVESAYKAHIDTSKWLIYRAKKVSSHSHHSALYSARHS